MAARDPPSPDVDTRDTGAEVLAGSSNVDETRCLHDDYGVAPGRVAMVPGNYHIGIGKRQDSALDIGCFNMDRVISIDWTHEATLALDLYFERQRHAGYGLARIDGHIDTRRLACERGELSGCERRQYSRTPPHYQKNRLHISTILRNYVTRRHFPFQGAARFRRCALDTAMEPALKGGPDASSPGDSD